MRHSFHPDRNLLSGGNAIFVLAAATALLMVVAWTVAWGILPPYGDDLMMTYPFRYGGDSAPGAMLHEYLNRYSDEGARISNVFFWLTIPAGQWCGAVAGGICFLTSLWLMARLSGAGRRAPATLAFGVCAYLLILPWHDGLAQLAFVFNYVGSTALMTAVLLLFMRGGGHSAAARCGTVALALLCGVWHEGFAVPLLCGCGMWCLINCRHAGATRWAVCIALAAGAAYLFSSPGLHGRMGHGSVITPDGIFSLETNRKFIMTWAYWLTLAACAAARRPDVGRRSIHPVALVTTAAVYVIFLTQPTYVRAVWPGETMALIGLMSITSRTAVGRRLRIAACAAAAAVCLLTWCHLWAFASATARLAAEHRELLRSYLASPDGRVWLDLTPYYLTDPLALKRPSAAQYSSDYLNSSYTTFYTRGRKPLRLAPLALRGADSLPGRLVEGSAGVRYHRGLYYMENARFDSLGHPYAFVYTLDNGRCSALTHNSVIFVTPAGGKFVWIHPGGAFSLLNGAEPVRIDLP